MRFTIVRLFPLLSLTFNIAYLFTIYFNTSREIAENFDSLENLLRSGRWEKFAVRRRSVVSNENDARLPDKTIMDGDRTILAVNEHVGADFGSAILEPSTMIGVRNRSTPVDHEHHAVYILDWTSFYGESMVDTFLSTACPNLPCRLTSDRRLLPRAEAVVFHPPDMYGGDWDWPPWRSSYQSYVMALWESPSSLIDVGWTDLRRSPAPFNLTMTYRSDSDIHAPYGYLEMLDAPREKVQFDRDLRATIVGKTKLVAWFVSHCETLSEREKFVAELRRYVPVDIYGDCGELRCERGSCDERTILSEYKFYLSLENSICKDYVTEKFYERLQHDIVPIVLGGAGNFESDGQNDGDRLIRYPPSGYIAATNFSSIEDLAEYISYLDKNPEAYAKYLEWKRYYTTVMSWQRLFRNSYCSLCRQLLRVRRGDGSERTSTSQRRRQWYRDIHWWWHTKFQCDDGLVRRRFLSG